MLSYVSLVRRTQRQPCFEKPPVTGIVSRLHESSCANVSDGMSHPAVNFICFVLALAVSVASLGYIDEFVLGYQGQWTSGFVLLVFGFWFYIISYISFFTLLTLLRRKFWSSCKNFNWYLSVALGIITLLLIADLYAARKAGRIKNVNGFDWLLFISFSASLCLTYFFIGVSNTIFKLNENSKDNETPKDGE